MEGARKSSWSRPGSKKSFTLTTLWNLEKLVKTYRGIIAHESLTFQKLMGLRREQHAELKKAHLRRCCNQDWTKIGGRIPWTVAAICEVFRDKLSDGKKPYERRVGEPFKEPVVPFG